MGRSVVKRAKIIKGNKSHSMLGYTMQLMHLQFISKTKIISTCKQHLNISCANLCLTFYRASIIKFLSIL